ncbi:hypothetical protein KR018_007337 [Drosophila ironensis]|nr:hypothetical protein KR018_007337 [Drosophila ironensis]
MKSLVICCMLLVVLVACVQVRADCEEQKKPEDSDFTHFVKHYACKVKEGAGEVAEAAKPYADKIGEGAKELRDQVSKKYDELKHKLQDDSSSTTARTLTYDAPTEKVPLAPIAPSPQPAL